MQKVAQIPKKSDSGPLYSGYVTCNKFQTEKQEIRILLTKIKHITKLHGQKTETTYSGAYLIIVADAADAVSVNFSGRCKFLQI